MSDFDFNFDIREKLNQDGFTNGKVVGISRDDIDGLFAEGIGAIYTAATRAFHGINHYNNGAALPSNYDLVGYTFFTRPRMKLSDGNILRDRALMPMLNEAALSIPGAIRAYLDPIGSGSPVKFTTKDTSFKKNMYPCPLVDPLNPFITILSNSLVSMTGWPDISVDTFESDAGIQKEKWAMYDGIAKYYGTFDLNCTFNNMRGDPIGLLQHMWTTYGTRVRWDELMIPWIDSIMDQEKDYETRIYRLVMDQTKTFVQKIACTGASFPTNSNTGASFDVDVNKPLNNKNDTHSMSFKCQAALYYDYYTAVAFNITVVDFNPNMYPVNRARLYTKIPPAFKRYFKDEGYPWINTRTSELEWYVPNERFKAVMENAKS